MEGLSRGSQSITADEEGWKVVRIRNAQCTVLFTNPYCAVIRQKKRRRRYSQSEIKCAVWCPKEHYGHEHV